MCTVTRITCLLHIFTSSACIGSRILCCHSIACTDNICFQPAAGERLWGVQEGRPRGAAVSAATFEWNEVLYIDIPYKDTLLRPETSTLLLLEVLQHPSSVKTWTNSRRKFSGGSHRAAWAFLDCSHPRTRAALHHGLERQQPVAMDLQLHRCKAVGFLNRLH